MNKRIKKAALIVCVMFTAAMFAACDGGGLFGNRDNSSKLKFLHIWPEHAVAMNKLINEFMIDNPDIEVEIVESTFQDVDNTLKNLVGTADMPDVFFQWTHYMNKWVPDGIPLDVTDIATELRDTMIGDGTPLDFGVINGKYYNIPFRATGFAIVYNKTMFDSHDDLYVPESIEQLETLLPLLKTKGVVPLAAYGGREGTLMQFNTAFNAFASIQSGVIDDPGYKTGRLMPDYTDPTGGYALLKTKRWSDLGYFGKYSTREQVQSAFMIGAAGMAILNNNEVNQLRAGMPDTELGIFAIPAPEAIADEARYVYGGFDGFSINSASNKLEQSKRLLRYLVSKDAQEKFGNSESSVMVNKNITYADPDMSEIASQMSYLGKYDVVADYNAGQAGTSTGNATVAFIDGNDNTLSGAMKLIEENTKLIEKALSDRLLNPPSGLGFIERTVKPKTYDNSWLTTGLL